MACRLMLQHSTPSLANDSCNLPMVLAHAALHPIRFILLTPPEASWSPTGGPQPIVQITGSFPSREEGGRRKGNVLHGH